MQAQTTTNHYDIDSLLYKTIIDKKEVYIDVKGQKKKLAAQITKGDIPEEDLRSVDQCLQNMLLTPKVFVDSNQAGGILNLNVSFIIEPSGDISNFRILNAFCQVNIHNPGPPIPLFHSRDFMAGVPTFKKITPHIVKREAVAVEVRCEMMIYITIDIQREKKNLGYEIKTD